jgi:hypothetical protein
MAFCRKTTTPQKFQKIHGKLNDFGQMCPFLRGFRFHENRFLQALAKKETDSKVIPMELRRELTVWAKCLMAAKSGFPIPLKQEQPPLYPYKFISDAAGAALSWLAGKPHNTSRVNDRGVASLGFQDDLYYFVVIVHWPTKFLDKFASNSTLLEAVGLLLPFLCIPTTLAGHHVELLVDNEALVYAWNKRLCKQSAFVSILVQALHLCEFILPCCIYVTHIPRCSTSQASLADRLSRYSTTTEKDLQQLQHLPIQHPAGPLMTWLQHPEPDWDLPTAQ